jgi:RNA polymerase sigma-70 factor (ECF subfamily)
MDTPISEFASSAVQKNSNPESQAANQQAVSALLNAVRKLPIGARQVVTLSLEGVSYQDIADICGTTTSNVGVILNRSKQQIMGIMNETD